MKIYKIENGKTVKEIEVANFIKKNKVYCFLVKDYFFKNCGPIWIHLYHGNPKVFYSLKRY